MQQNDSPSVPASDFWLPGEFPATRAIHDTLGTAAEDDASEDHAPVPVRTEGGPQNLGGW